LMKSASAVIAELDQQSIQSLLEGATLSIDVEGTSVELNQDKILVERLEKANLKVVNEGTLTVALDAEITEELQREGYVRDLIRGIQNLRKETGLDVTDRIILTLSGNEILKKSYEQFVSFIKSETLTVSVNWVDEKDATSLTVIDAGDLEWRASVEKN